MYREIKLERSGLMNIASQSCALVVLVVIAIFFMTSKPLKLQTTIAFYIMLFMTMGMVVTDIVSIYLLNNLETTSPACMEVFARLYLFFLNAVVYSAIYYTYSDVYGNTKTRKTIAILKAIVFIVADIVMLISPVYWSSENHIVYTYGPAVDVTYVIGIYGIFVLFYLVISSKRFMNKRRRYAIGLWVMVWIVAAAIQFVVQTLLIVTFAGVIGVLIVYIMLENPDSRMDRRTGLLNMKAFEAYARKMFELERKFFVYIIVADELSDLVDTDKTKLNRKYLDKFINSIKILKTPKIFFDGNDQMIVVFEENTASIYDRKVFESHIEEAGRDGYDIYGLAKYFYIPDCTFTNSVYYFEKLIRYARQNNHDVLAKERVLIDEEMFKKMMEEIEGEELLLEALEDDRVEMYYQPIYSTVKHRFTTVEALVRIKDKEGNIIPPAKFISIAEENGMIIKLGEVIFEKVCRFIGGEDFPKLELEYVEINLSVVQCCYAKLARNFIDIMDRYSVNPKFINLEITESASIEGKNILLKNMEKLRNYGVKFSLDDFGTGYSNLAYLQNFNVDIIKIDRSFVNKAMEDENIYNVISHIIDMAHNLNITVCIEGIENVEEQDKICKLLPDTMQGYLYGRPVPAQEFTEINISRYL